MAYPTCPSPHTLVNTRHGVSCCGHGPVSPSTSPVHHPHSSQPHLGPQQLKVFGADCGCTEDGETVDPGKYLPQCLIEGLKLQDPAGYGGSCQSALPGLLAQKTPESLRTRTPPSQDEQCSPRCWSGLPTLPTLLQTLQRPPGEAHPTLIL